MIIALSLAGALAGCGDDDDNTVAPPQEDPEIRRVRVPSEAPTLQAGIDSAAAGDTVVVAPGTYTGDGNRDLEFGGKPITLRADGPAGSVTIDCQGTAAEPHRGILFTTGEDESTIVRDIRVVNGYGGGVTLPYGNAAGDLGAGGAIACIGASPVLQGCTFEDCFAASGGAIFCFRASPVMDACSFVGDSSFTATVHCEDSDPSISGSTFTGNRTPAVGGIYSAAGSDPNVVSCDFEDNIGVEAGSIFVDEASINVSGCTFTGDSAVDRAAVFYVHDGTADFTDCTFTGNRGGESGVGFFNVSKVAGGGSLTGCTFSTNHGNDAGALYLWYDTVVLIDNCEFIDNEAENFGGAVDLWNNSSATITSSIFRDNTAERGGAINIWNASHASLTSCTFLENSAQNGGAVNLWDNTVATFEGCIFARNTSPEGGVANLWANANATFTDCTMWANAGTTAAGGIWCENSTVTLAVENTIIGASTAGAAIACNPSASITMSCCDVYANDGGNYSGCIAGFLGVDGNISADPLLCNPGADDFHLDAGSPCVSAGGCGQIGALGTGCIAAP